MSKDTPSMKIAAGRRLNPTTSNWHKLQLFLNDDFDVSISKTNSKSRGRICSWNISHSCEEVLRTKKISIISFRVMLRPAALSLVFLCTLVKAASSGSGARQGCREKCGDISVFYPFGIGDRGCFKEPEHELFCDETYDPPALLLGLADGSSSSTTQVLNVSLSGQLTITSWVAFECYKKTGASSNQFNNLNTVLGKTYAFSDVRNMFISVGCDTRAFLKDPVNGAIQSGCVSFCGDPLSVRNGSCSGVGCCETSIPKNLKALRVDTGSYSNHTETWDFNPCSYAFVADQTWFEFSSSNLKNFTSQTGFSFGNRSSTPVAVDWVAGTEACQQAQQNTTAFSCGQNSFCSDSIEVPGHRCFCNDGYQGNPYLPDGCQDIDECSDPDNSPCEGVCNNTPGGYFCACPAGTIGDNNNDRVRCRPDDKKFPVLQFSSGLGVGVLCMLIAIYWTCWGLQKRKMMKLKEKFFEKNGGFLLQQQLLMRDPKMEVAWIFTKGELEKATDNYAESRVLGRGGYGTVYKGILPKGRVVAIKKSKTMDQNQIDQFINEVVVLSQINHSNVVKLLGCCLETEVPLLVYELVNNGTLYDHVHRRDMSFPWGCRLRIAAETAGALAYLHSAASPPIIHRDIKSTNILLDKNLRAKVSDFGASRLVPIDQSQLITLVQGTLGYLDPEYFLTSQLTEKSDVYSFGVVLVELLTGMKVVSFERPEEQRNLAMHFVSSMKRNQLNAVLDKDIIRDETMQQVHGVANVAMKCLKMDADERPTMKEVVLELQRLSQLKEHPWAQESDLATCLLRQPSNGLNSYTLRCDTMADQELFELALGR
uniref:Uncharacterized protein n=1 Tax=Kalanchoe fedtschenkoi TaxID=63787 RepID=A0A7N0UTW9_KALFE